jgi:hypothetical protein
MNRTENFFSIICTTTADNDDNADAADKDISQSFNQYYLRSHPRHYCIRIISGPYLRHHSIKIICGPPVVL